MLWVASAKQRVLFGKVAQEVFRPAGRNADVILVHGRDGLLAVLLDGVQVADGVANLASAWLIPRLVRALLHSGAAARMAPPALPDVPR